MGKYTGTSFTSGKIMYDFRLHDDELVVDEVEPAGESGLLLIAAVHLTFCEDSLTLRAILVVMRMSFIASR